MLIDLIVGSWRRRAIDFRIARTLVIVVNKKRRQKKERERGRKINFIISF